MKKPNIKKLQYPLWFNIIFIILTVVIPVGTLVVLGLRSPSKVFRITFTMICILLVIWVFIRRFAIKHFEDKVKEKKILLEHDYEIEAGNPDKCKWLWFTNEIWLSIINAIQVALTGLLIVITMIGIQEAAIKITGAVYLVMSLYIVSYTFKFILLLIYRRTTKNEEDS